MLSELLKSLLSSYNIKYHVVEHRTKSIESVEEKITRKEIENINQLTDISGLRIILYYQDDVDQVLKMIKDNFKIDEKNSINKAELYSSNEFGYLSLHSIVTLDNKRNKLPEWKNYSLLKAEIQIRTVLQHSWASISHELTYKKNYEIPNELQRRLFRLAGLFELADEQFLKIRDEHLKLNSAIKEISLSDKIESEKINLLTLKYSIDKDKSIYQQIEQIAWDAGFEKSIADNEKEKYLSDIILTAELLDLEYIKDIENLLKENKDKISIYLKEVRTITPTKWLGSRSFLNLISLLYFLNDKQLDQYFSNTSWSAEMFAKVRSSLKKVKDL